MEQKGLLLKCLGGFYYVEADDGKTYECRARGIFRKRGMSPYAGDRVTISTQEDGTGSIEAIEPRKNSLIRPPVANMDQLFIVVAVREPAPSTLIIAKTIAAAESKGIEPVLVISKTDLEDAGWLCEIYEKAGIPCVPVSSVTGEGVERIRAMLQGKLSAFTGNSGVGKSTLLNRVAPRLSLETGEISQKLGRGRHTTRHVELFRLDHGAIVADTPGFSSFDTEETELRWPETLERTFQEFAPYLGRCRFTGCAHVKEKGCAVLAAVKAGEISKSRHASYVRLYEQAKEVPEWQRKESAD